MAKTLIQKLADIQKVLKAPKNQRNNFGGYNYRSAEDILEAVKPLAIDNGALVKIHDEVIQVGDRIYVKAVVELHDLDTDAMLTTSAFAREEETKKGMDGSQITGAASSYARKYALNGMFAIDDTKDSDATNDHGRGGQERPHANAGQVIQQAAKKQVNPKYKEAWTAYVKHPQNDGVDAETMKTGFKNLCTTCIGDKPVKDYTDEDWDKVINNVKELGSDIPF